MLTKFIALLIPLLLSNVLQATSAFATNIYLGQLLSTHALAAIALLSPVFLFLYSLVTGIAAGTGIIVAQAHGAEKTEAILHYAGSAVALVLSCSLLITVVGFWTAPLFLRWLATPADLFPSALRYFRCMLCAFPLFALLTLLASLSQAIGDTLSSLWVLSTATLISLVATPAFILGWLAMPQQGVLSPALANILAYSLAFISLMIIWRRQQHPLALSRRLLGCIAFNSQRILRLCRLGLPTAVQSVLLACAEMVLLSLVNRHGSTATAAYGVVTLLMGCLQIPGVTVGITASILAAQAIGASQRERVANIARVAMLLNLACTSILTLAIYLYAYPILGLFLHERNAHALALGLLELVAWCIVLMGMTNVIAGIFRANAKVMLPMAFSLFSVFAIELPLARLFNAQHGITGIWWAYACTFVANFILHCLYYVLYWHRHDKPIQI